MFEALLLLLVFSIFLTLIYLVIGIVWGGMNKDNFSSPFNMKRIFDSIETKDLQSYYKSTQWKFIKQNKLERVSRIHPDLYNVQYNIFMMREDDTHPFGEVVDIKTGKRIDHLCLVNKKGLKEG